MCRGIPRCAANVLRESDRKRIPLKRDHYPSLHKHESLILLSLKMFAAHLGTPMMCTSSKRLETMHASL